MPDFNTLFPNFTNRCVELSGMLTPIAYLLLVGGVVSWTISGHRSGAAYMRTFGRTIVFVTLLTFLVPWGNTISRVVDSTVKDVLKVDPSKIYDNYQKALEMKKAAEGEKSWWEKVFEWRTSLLEAILTGIFFFSDGLPAQSCGGPTFCKQRFCLLVTALHPSLSASLLFRVCTKLAEGVF